MNLSPVPVVPRATNVIRDFRRSTGLRDVFWIRYGRSFVLYLPTLTLSLPQNIKRSILYTAKNRSVDCVIIPDLSLESKKHGSKGYTTKECPARIHYRPLPTVVLDLDVDLDNHVFDYYTRPSTWWGSDQSPR